MNKNKPINKRSISFADRIKNKDLFEAIKEKEAIEQKPKEYEECCYECGEQRYGKQEFQGITVRKDICKFCNKKRLIIPAIDWAGYGD